MRLTTRGVGLLIAGIVLVWTGFWFGYPELAVVGCASLIAVLGAAIFVAWRPRLDVTRVAAPDRLTRGEASNLTLNVSNSSRLFGASLVARDRLRPGEAVAVPLVRLRPGGQTSVTYPVPTTRRAVVEIGPLEITRRDPLGLVGAARDYGPSVKVWVRPRVHPIVAVPVGLSRSMDGRVDRVPHGSITFAALREYVVGDDLRRVHWRTSARVGELMVREHVDTSLPRVVVVLDDRASAHTTGYDDESTFEAACEAAASVIVAAVREDIHIELHLVSGAAAAGGGVEVGPLLDLLAEVTLVPDRVSSMGVSSSGVPSSGVPSSGVSPIGVFNVDLAASVQKLRVRRSGDTLLYLTGPPNHDDLGLVAGLRGAYPSIIAGVFGPVESGLATTAGLLMVGAVDGADFAAAWDGVRAW